MNGVGEESSCEQMTSIAKSDLSAGFNLDLLYLVQRFGKNIHHQDLVVKSNDNMEATWVEGN